MNDVLHVFLNGNRVGHLTVTKAPSFSFQYDPIYLKRTDAVPVSSSLPLVEGAFDESTSVHFFENLLPEHNVRSALAHALKMTDHDIFNLLRAVGGECAGAYFKKSFGCAIYGA